MRITKKFATTAAEALALTDDEVADIINDTRTPISIRMSKDGIFLHVHTRRWEISASQAEVVLRCMHARTA